MACCKDVFGALGLPSTDGAERGGQRRIACATVPNEGADDILYVLDLLGGKGVGGVFFHGILDLGTVLDRCSKVRRMLRACWFWVLIFCELAANVARHREINVAHFVVPVERDTTKELAFPVDRDFVVLFECRFQMLGMLDALTFYAKVINDKAEDYWAPDVPEKAWGVLTLVVPLLEESLFKKIVGKNASLREAVHATDDFDVHPTFACNGL